MNTVMSYASDAFGGRSRAFSFDGQPVVAQQAPVSPRFYPSNQPTYRPTYGGPVGPVAYQQPTAYPAYTTAPQPYPMGGPGPVVGMSGMGVSNSQVCCPLPGPTEEPAPSQSAHAFQSNLPAGECEGLVRRDVEYQTEWVAVPVQKPVVYETYQRVIEVPTQHLVNVQNVPGNVPARQCDPVGTPGVALAPSSYGVAPVGYGAAPQVMQTIGAPIAGPDYYSAAPVAYTNAPVAYNGAPVAYNGAPVAYNAAPVAGAPVYGGYGYQTAAGTVSPVPAWGPAAGPAVTAGQVAGPMRTFSY